MVEQANPQAHEEFHAAEFNKLPPEYQKYILDRQRVVIFYPQRHHVSSNDIVLFRPDQAFLMHLLKVDKQKHIKIEFDGLFEKVMVAFSAQVSHTEVPAPPKEPQEPEKEQAAQQSAAKVSSFMSRLGLRAAKEEEPEAYELEFGLRAFEELREQMGDIPELQGQSPYNFVKVVDKRPSQAMFICAEDSKWVIGLQLLIKSINPDYRLLKSLESDPTLPQVTKVKELFKEVELGNEFILVSIAHAGSRRSIELWKDFRITFLTPQKRFSSIIVLPSVLASQPEILEHEVIHSVEERIIEEQTRESSSPVSEPINDYSRAVIRSFLMYSKIVDLEVEIDNIMWHSPLEHFKTGKGQFPALNDQEAASFWQYRRVLSKAYRGSNLKECSDIIDCLLHPELPFVQYSGSGSFSSWGSDIMKVFEVLNLQEQVYRKELILDAKTKGHMKVKRSKDGKRARGGKWRKIKENKARIMREQQVSMLTGDVLATMNFMDQSVPAFFKANSSLEESQDSSKCSIF